MGDRIDEAGASQVMELYIAGDSPSSRQARLDLVEIVRRLGDATTEIVVIDVLVNPQAALAQQIFTTPSLIAIQNGRKTLVVGDLSDHEALARRLASRP